MNALETTRGDLGEQEFGEIMRAFQGRVKSLVRKMGVPLAEVDDIVQEVFMKWWKAGTKIDERGAWPFLRKATHNVVFSRFRRKREREAIAPDLSSVAWTVEKPETPEAILLARNEFSGLLSALNSQQRKVVEMHIEGLSPTEIADQIGARPGSVYTAMHKARKMMRGLMADA